MDRALVERGLAETRTKARAAIAAGLVAADGVRVDRPSKLVSVDAVFEYAPEHQWVSRGALKLLHALDVFALSAAQKRCLDIGASTGGFTEVLLARGAARVVAVDVGHGQLHPRIAADERVHSREGLDARHLVMSDIGEPAELIVCDASFIGATKVLLAPMALAADVADLVLLIKPQYETGPGGPRTILSPEDGAQIAARVAAELDGLGGFRRRQVTRSAIDGRDGSPEFLYWARKG